MGNRERSYTCDERERRHQDRAKTYTCRMHGRFLRIHAFVVLPLLGKLDDQDRVLGGQPKEHNKSDLREDVDRHCPMVRPVVAASRHIGTISTIASGIFQLSYCAASTRNTKRAEAPKIATVGMPFFAC